MNGGSNLEDECSEFVEVDPTGRYGRYNEILGKGASKTVYRGFDEYEGIEVAWNQVKLYDFLQSPEDLERLYCEIHLLKTLKHKNIMKFYTSWVDTSKRNINFVTEMFTSGTLRQYRLKHRKVNIRAVKHWCRQILRGLYYLHSHDPPIIHRDLKCDNIFVNGNQGEVKIGDLGLAAILRKSHAAHCVGTPEFMAPEVYEEEYNELVDIYSFGMCVLEMVTFEYPYSECNYPAEIYKKVISGKKPDALYNVKDPEVRQFIEKCLATVSLRLSAKELLDDPFLQIDDYNNDMRLTDFQSELDGLSPLMKQPFLEHYTSDSSFNNGFSNGVDMESYEWGYHSTDVEASGIELFEHHDDDHFGDVDITIKGKKQDDGSIFLRLRIADKEGRIRNIYFPFDVELDTALSVATEMVGELDITDQDVTSIADMIDGEIASLVPDWKTGPGIVETPRFSEVKLCRNCASTHTSVGSLLDILSNNPGAFNSPFFQCPNGCEAAMHGRFEEITYQADSTHEHEHNVTEASDEEPDEQHQVELWDHCERVEISSHECQENSGHPSPPSNKGENNPENNPDNVQRDFRWLKAKFQLELREIRDHQLGMLSKSALSRHFYHSLHQNLHLEHDRSNSTVLEDFQKSCPVSRIPRARNSEAMIGGLYDANNLCAGSLLPSTLHRTTSLPVDAVYI